MHSAQPLEILADELGAAAGRIERELRLKDEARAARFEARLAAIELAAFKAEEDRQRKFEARMSELRDGRDGEPGKDGKDADIGPVLELVDGIERKQRSFLESLEADLSTRVDAKLAEVRDGKDGEPGRDGKDADIEPLLKAFDHEKVKIDHRVACLEISLDEKLETKLSEVKDGKDGEPGKDADIEPLMKRFNESRLELVNDFNFLEKNLVALVSERLAEVKDGQDGKEGPPGKDGEDGKMPIAREWTNRVHYAGDVVRHSGATYQALTDTGSEPPHGDWGELASRGTDGRGFVLRGTYDASAEYRQHDIVMINRNSFAAKYDDPGECPGEGWQLFGPSGQRGKEGPPGSPGAKGADGRIVSITKWEADPDEMVLRIADSTGNTFTVDLQPIAERILEAAR